MKKNVILTALCAVLLSSCILEKRADLGDLGEKVTREEKVGTFDRLVLVGSFDVKYVQGDSCSVQVTGREGDLDKLTCETEDGTLTIDRRSHENSGIQLGRTPKVEVVVSSPALTRVELAGACDFEAEQTVRASKLKFAIAGAADVDLADLVCDTLLIDVAGAGDVDAKVTGAQLLKLSISGAGDADLKLKDCGDVTCNIAGAGSIDLQGNARSLRKTVAGVGSIDADGLKIGK